mmetsp:Transcript_14617/g.30285  ORF Transcript_14617/g.30285 Transcript_14617/m.30285 type:complete len:210 (+) Transcript_14617:715-1344(+)
MLCKILLWTSSSSCLRISFSDRSLLSPMAAFIFPKSVPISAYRCPISLYCSSNRDISCSNESPKRGTGAETLRGTRDSLPPSPVPCLAPPLVLPEGTCERFGFDDNDDTYPFCSCSFPRSSSACDQSDGEGGRGSTGGGGLEFLSGRPRFFLGFGSRWWSDLCVTVGVNAEPPPREEEATAEEVESTASGTIFFLLLPEPPVAVALVLV